MSGLWDRRRALKAGAAVVGAVWVAPVILSVDAASAATVPPAPARYAYVANSGDNSVSVIDTVTDTVVGSAIVVANTPQGVAVSPDGSLAYVTNWGSPTKIVSVIDTASTTVVATIVVGNNPLGVAFTPDGTKAIVTNWGFNSVMVIDTATNEVIGSPIPAGGFPTGVVVNPTGDRAYVTAANDDSVKVIDLGTNAVITTVFSGFGPNPQGIAIDPTGAMVYVANTGYDFGDPDFIGHEVSVMATATNTVSTTVVVGAGPFGVAVNPAGTRLYVTNSFDGTVSVVNTVTNLVIGSPITVGDTPQGVAVNAAGTKVYVTNYGDGTVSVIETVGHTVVETITVGSGPYAVAI